ncbi:DUF5947 family protein [Microtetraspora sp. NBRC 16547]|uniref:DUF5947 family protein n=1 Tax=Microtetraspora sp. NBRC 16547 TaxID=3030993 RepID=UPI0024A41278|nr:DUF5947 family protein [Microtetraspora sp. NBRC 16547]GLW99230.1 hypothetical protein Misp02_33170 [Microtetraspora sp. NBRC 16547]
MERRITMNALRRYLVRPQDARSPAEPRRDASEGNVSEGDLSGRSVPGRDVPERSVSGRCDLCGVPVADDHRHLIDLSSREIRCACRPCATLFDRAERGGQRYRAVPDRRWYLRGFALDDAAWDGLHIPVQMAFFFHDSSARRAVLHYPSLGGPVESPLARPTWARLEAANPVLGGLAPDVEALLVNRTGDARDHWIVPIDDCYALVGLIRTRWKGLAGGPDVWREIGGFFTALRGRSRTVDAGGGTHDGNRPEGAKQ